ncbi:hypothetical protein KL86PLE_90714 [uncultured Pleomorphomonas sp.]|uniref:Uncharacterized protein n=1 Tax=uncultured Pleomorphomonas sp. TaxID=442121 RepID=A0A212LR28_9HYPH|nr:hypothetical protein [uncultured Pleomorphomonas sp.]SCM79931.1 hypothetical protein KL86PLE_90714 [uncultured Pleomorphomonas sp.]
MTTSEPEIFAVIWCDFIPLHLPFGSAPEAVAFAKEMAARAVVAGVNLVGLRAVRLPEGSDVLETLWEP